MRAVRLLSVAFAALAMVAPFSVRGGEYTRAQLDRLVLHGGTYGHDYLSANDQLAVEAEAVAVSIGGPGWRKTYQHPASFIQVFGAANTNTHCLLTITVSGPGTLTVTPLRYSCPQRS